MLKNKLAFFKKHINPCSIVVVCLVLVLSHCVYVSVKRYLIQSNILRYQKTVNAQSKLRTKVMLAALSYVAENERLCKPNAYTPYKQAILGLENRVKYINTTRDVMILPPFNQKLTHQILDLTTLDEKMNRVCHTQYQTLSKVLLIEKNFSTAIQKNLETIQSLQSKLLQ